MPRLPGLARLFLLAFALLAPLAAPGCAAPRTEQGPALWRLSDADSEIWLFGTVHLLPAELKWQSAKVDRAFDAADTIYFETQTDGAAEATIGQLVATLGANPPGVTLSSQLNEADRALLAQICTQLKLDPAAFEKVRPWLAGVQLSVAFVMTQGLNPESGVERVFEKRAQAAGKKRAYFETSEQQLRFFANLPREAEIGFLHSTLVEIRDEKENFDAINNAWATGDVKKMATYFDGMTEELGPEVYEALIVGRNRRWAEEIDQMMKGSGKTFIAVGAAHLIGKDSVTEMLRAKGYKIEGP